MERSQVSPEPGPHDGSVATPDRAAARWLVAFVALGVLARVVRYGLGFALWEDECFVVVNLFEKSFASLLGPLDFVQVAPPLWLVAEKAVAEALGYSELSLRLVAFVSSLASLALFVAAASRLLAGWEATLAVGVFAVSYPCVRYAAEAKPYGVDLLVSTALLLAALRLAEAMRPGRWIVLAGLLAVGPWLSFPSVFVGGTVVLLGFLRAVRAPGPGRRVVAGAPWAAAGVVHVLGLAAAQASLASAVARVLPEMQHAWSGGFPPLAEPLRVPLWLLSSFVGPLLAYPVGGPNAGSVATAVAVIAGAVALARTSRRAVLGLCLAPFALHLVAATVHRYPFGGHPKFSLYAAPFISILVGAGLVPLARHLPVRGERAKAAGAIGAVLLLAVGLVTVGRDLARPYKNLSDEQARRFARKLWTEAPRQAETVCLAADLGLSFQLSLRDRTSWFATYRANQILYSPRHRRRESPHLENVSTSRPLLVVEYRVTGVEYDEQALHGWLAGTEERFELVEERRIRSRAPIGAGAAR